MSSCLIFITSILTFVTWPQGYLSELKTALGEDHCMQQIYKSAFGYEDLVIPLPEGPVLHCNALQGPEGFI